jgi:hypothetical protein
MEEQLPSSIAIKGPYNAANRSPFGLYVLEILT